MTKLTEIRWHGRGGQGAKTAALLFGDALLGTGFYMQAFPEYGPERMGAPVKAYNRISDAPIDLHSGVDTPDVVVVLDVSLMKRITNVTEGLADDGILLVNSPDSPAEVRKETGLQKHRLYTVDASSISQELMGSNHPNTPMLGALLRVADFVDYGEVKASIRQKLARKFHGRDQIVEGNMAAVERAYQEVSGG